MSVRTGQHVISRNVLLSVPTGEALLGRIIDPLGNPLDGKGPIVSSDTKVVETIAPSIISRTPVNTPLETGLKIVDSIIPIGHGQRELIIGDGKIGKTAIAIDSILSQKNTDTLCIYVAIGQKRSSVARTAKILESRGRMESTIIIAATASNPAALQFVAPYCGVAMAEYFMDLGLRVLIIHDDLTKHAVSYRQLSLLLRRPPGREGYPGDIFYVHSKLLERAANLLKGGSITALPIVETIQSDLSAYIPTNVISITDGQIFLERDLFASGTRPAVSAGLSVSRVGSAAQNNVLKSMAGKLKLELAQFREVESFSKLGLTLDAATTQSIDRGLRSTRTLVQKHFNPMPMDEQILFFHAATQGFLDTIPSSQILHYERELMSYYNNSPLKFPVQGSLMEEKNNELPEDIVNFLIHHFSDNFYKHIDLFESI
jgi:F-type H+-transporting ATPase subunit alpha